MDTLSDHQKMKVLILDDDRTMLRFLETILGPLYELRLAKNYYEFQKTLQTFNPHVMLIDLVLPDANGLEICSSLRKSDRYSDRIIIVVTGSDDRKTVDNSYSAGATDFIRKPFIASELKAKIEVYERILRFQISIRESNAALEHANSKLFQLNRQIQKILSAAKYADILMRADFLADIFPVNYIEIIGTELNTHTVLSQRTIAATTVVSFETLRRHSKKEIAQEGISFKPVQKGDETIYVCIIGAGSPVHGGGFILLESAAPFREDDQQMLTLFSDFLQLTFERYESNRIIEKNMRDYRYELAKVRKIQVSMLPDFKKIRGYDVASTYMPANELSGDFFDGYYLKDNIYQITVCDVSGHGIASAYVGNEIRTLIKNLSDAAVYSLAEVFRLLNDMLVDDLEGLFYFATIVGIRMDTTTGEMSYVSCGHPPMLLYNSENDRIEDLKNTGPLVGVFKNAQFEEKEITLRKNDSLLLYTDGITEAHAGELNNTAEMFGEERLKKIFHQSHHLSAGDTLHSVVGSVYEFVEYCEQADDITALCIRHQTQ